MAGTAWLVLQLGLVLPGQPIPAGPLEFGLAAGQPGEVVRVPVYASFDQPLRHLFAVFVFDAERLEFLRYDVSGSAATRVNPLSVGSRNYAAGEASFGIFPTGYDPSPVSVPPGERVFLGSLLFRVRATAQAGPAAATPVEHIPSTGGGPSYTYWVDDNLVEAKPSSLVSGSVEVQSPAGPRPVGDLVCEQRLDRIHLAFQPTETYDWIEVARDGARIATLPGDASQHMDPVPSVGQYRYTVTAILRDQTSVPVDCQVRADPPAAPAVLELTCGDAGLTWQNPIPFDRITIFRNGEEIAQLPGIALSFVDQDQPESMTLYSVVSELEGFRSPQANCLDHSVWIMEVGDVQVPVEATRVFVPIYATTAEQLENWECHLQIPQDRLRYTRDRDLALQGTALHPGVEIFATGIGSLGLPAIGIIFDAFPPPNPEKKLLPGLRQLIFHFPFEVTGPFRDGETFRVSIEQGSFGRRNKDQGLESVKPTRLSGLLRFGNAGPPPVEELRAAVEAPGAEAAEGEAAGAGGGAAAGSGSNVLLSWRNTASYDKIRVERNGVVVGEIDGHATGFRDASVPDSVYTYKVVGEEQGATSFPAHAFLSTVAPRDGFLRGDSNRDGNVNITDPLVTLRYLFRSGEAPRCEDAADADDDGRITITDAIMTLQYLFLGVSNLPAPGTAYPWYDPTPDSLSCTG
jgi:hypothetical protein